MPARACFFFQRNTSRFQRHRTNSAPTTYFLVCLFFFFRFCSDFIIASLRFGTPSGGTQRSEAIIEIVYTSPFPYVTRILIDALVPLCFWAVFLLIAFASQLLISALSFFISTSSFYSPFLLFFSSPGAHFSHALVTYVEVEESQRPMASTKEIGEEMGVYALTARQKAKRHIGSWSWLTECQKSVN